MESSVRLCLKLLLFSGLMVVAYTYPKKTELDSTYRHQHLPEIPGYIPVYIKQEQPNTAYKSHPLRTTKPKGKPQSIKDKEDHGKWTTNDHENHPQQHEHGHRPHDPLVLQKPVKPSQNPLKPQPHKV